MAVYTDADGRPKAVTLRGRDLADYPLAEQILSGRVSLSTKQLTQMSLTFREPAEWPVLSKGYLTPSNGLGTQYYNDGACDIGPLQLQIGTMSIAAAGQGARVTFEARSLGGQRMKVNTDPSMLSRVSYSSWVKVKVESLGMRFVGEQSPQVEQVGNSNGQDSWTTVQKLAGDLGYWAFEAAGTFYFARPSWLLGRSKRWACTFTTVDREDDPLVELPACSRDETGKAQVTAKYVPGQDGMMPGDGLVVKGIPTFDGTYIITDVDVDFGATGVVTVKAETPVDPTPKGLPKTQSPELMNASAAVGTTVRNPGAGSYGGTRLNDEQTENVRRILQVCQDRGLNPRAGLLSIMCALQESTLRNLAGGDRDSVGLFQQRPSQGWGTVAQCRNPEYATGKFLDVLVKQKDWRTGTPTKVIQAVQRSGFPNAYAKWQPVAQALLNASLVTSVIASPAASGDATVTVNGARITVRPLNGSQTYQQIVDIGSFGPPHRVTSTVRNGGGRSYHDRGMAVDFAGVKPSKSSPELLAIFKYWMHFYESVEEIIYYGPGGSGVKSGKPYTYSNAVQRDHLDHVHVAVTADQLRKLVAKGAISFR